MKKLFFVLAVAGALVACDNSGSGNNNADSANNADTQSVAPVTPDTNTTVTPDTNTTTNADTANKSN